MPPVYCDIAVIGGGLAGLSFAVQAADAGYKVMLFEKEQYPFHKVCGEYISMESWDFLERIGIPLRHWSLPQIHQLCISDCTGRQYDFPLPTGGFGISRYKLDDALYRLALTKGVNVITGNKVTEVSFADDRFSVSAGTEAYTAKLVTCAFGKRSNLDIRWNRSFVQAKPGKLDHYIGVKYHIRYPQPAGTISLHNFENGYCGISRIEEDRCCLCYLTTAANLRRHGNSIEQMEATLLSGNVRLRDIFSKAERLYRQPLTISQISFQQKEQIENHMLMLGDAAGMITPLCGNGMSMAMHASVIALEQVSVFMNGSCSRDDMEEKYRQVWQHHFAKRTAMGRRIQRMFGSPFTTSLFLKTMHGIPALANVLIKQTHGASF